MAPGPVIASPCGLLALTAHRRPSSLATPGAEATPTHAVFVSKGITPGSAIPREMIYGLTRGCRRCRLRKLGQRLLCLVDGRGYVSPQNGPVRVYGRAVPGRQLQRRSGQNRPSAGAVPEERMPNLLEI